MFIGKIMRNTVSLPKSSSPQVRALAQKVVKLASSGRKKLPAATSALRADKAERTVRSSNKLVDLKPEKKTAAKTGAGTAVKTAKASNSKTASKRSKASTTAAAAVASAGTAAKPKKVQKAPVHLLARVQEPKSNAAKKETVATVDADPRLRPLPAHTAALPAAGGQLPRLAPDDIKIFQIYYLPEQQSSLDPDFTPYDNSGNTSRLFEFSVFTKLAQSDQVKGAALWGALSWKFGTKAGISGLQLKEEILAYPGYDAYYSNPFPENEALFHNMWLQGEIAHPNFMPLCTEIFEVAGLPAEMLNSVQPASEFAAANYFVASQAFWRAYIGFISRILIIADKKLSPTAKRILYSSTADKFGAHAEASYIPFLVERLFTVFLRTDGARFRTFKLKLDEREKKDNVHLKLLSEMKDVACRTKSTWLAACWINYRNLYLSKTFGESWIKHNLKRITPPNIVFMPDFA
jgi:hypothetical protein